MWCMMCGGIACEMSNGVSLVGEFVWFVRNAADSVWPADRICHSLFVSVLHFSSSC